ncbi:hypothetical protein EV669_1095 [Gulbenkiania mobilis]|uniref:Uncharacterized protein n=2 Tax=Gulbenkiania mobilis TaxID=397457 RepID=A0ABY2CUI5_GULMO|nr:hypothetical protein EV669_1095 [Gulbenkiania mobilis]
MTLATQHQPRHNAPVPFNSGAGFGDSSNLADNRHNGGFFTSVYHPWYVQFMAGHGGDTFGYAGSKFRFANPAMCLPPPFGDGWQAIQINLEATMPSITRAIRALLSRTHSVSVIRTAPTLSEARRIAAHLVDAGARCRITAVAHGFDVEAL